MNEPKVERKGKRYKESHTVEFENTSEGNEAGWSLMANQIGNFEEMIQFAKNKLAENGYDIDKNPAVFRGDYFEKDSMPSQKRKDLIKSGLLIKADSKENDLVALWQNCQIATNQNNPVEARLDSAFRAGDYFRRLAVYSDYGKTQSDIAQQERKRGLTDIFQKLKKMKDSGQKPKDLWPNFISMLNEAKGTYDQVNEVKVNHLNPKSWYVRFLIIANSDEKVTKEETMKYERFRRRLSDKK